MERDIIKKIPKRRGYGKNRGRTIVGNAYPVVAVNLSRIEGAYSDGETVTLVSLKERGLAPRKASVVKVLGTGNLTKKLTVEGLSLSESARTKIEKAGGKVQ
jgi:large subunit ribosomal protein L15